MAFVTSFSPQNYDVFNNVHKHNVSLTSMALQMNAPKLFEIYKLFNDHELLMQFMRNKKLLKSQMKCTTCGENMVISKKSSKPDGEEWKCSCY